MALVNDLGELRARLDALRVDHPRMQRVSKVCDTLRSMKRHAPHAPQKLASVFAQSQSGKSTTIVNYIATTVVNDVLSSGEFPADLDRCEVARLQRKVVHVTLSSKATLKQLASDILCKLGDPYSHVGTSGSLMQRAYDWMRKAGTELLIIDEIQSLSTNRTRRADGSRGEFARSTEVTDGLKIMLIRGLVPIVLVGVEEARHYLFGDPQLAARCIEEVNFQPLRFERSDEQKMFIEFCGQYGCLLEQAGLFEEPANLVVGDVPWCLHEASGGMLGMATNIIDCAAIAAAERGEQRVCREHLEIAIDEYSITKGYIDYNPIREGVRAGRVRPEA